MNPARVENIYAKLSRPGGRQNIKMLSSSIGIPILKIRRSRDRLIFHMGIPYLGNRVFILRQSPVPYINITQGWWSPCLHISKHEQMQYCLRIQKVYGKWIHKVLKSILKSLEIKQTEKLRLQYISINTICMYICILYIYIYIKKISVISNFQTNLFRIGLSKNGSTCWVDVVNTYNLIT